MNPSSTSRKQPVIDAEKLDMWKRQYDLRNYLFREEWEAVMELAKKALAPQSETKPITERLETAEALLVEWLQCSDAHPPRLLGKRTREFIGV